MVSSSGEPTELELINAANKLLKPTSNTKELLSLLSNLEDLLSKVEQSPSQSMLEALRPSFSAVLIDEVLRHSDADVKISVAYCFSELMRITAPKEPFNDDQMKEFFHLTVMSFQKLCSASVSNYSKISTILRIFSHFRLCVLILDLELNELVVQMFQHFFNVVGSNISDPLLLDIRNIMTIVLEEVIVENEEFSYELLSLLIASVKNENQCASPCSWKLGEEVLKSCTVILKPRLPQVVKRMGIDLNDYAKIVASICLDESIEEANKYALVAISTGEVLPSVSGPLTLPMDDSAQMRKDEAMDVKNTQMMLSCCNQAAKPKRTDVDECGKAAVVEPQGYIDSSISKNRPKKPNPKYEEGYNSGLIVLTPDWTKHGKRTHNSFKNPASMVLALPIESKSETKPRHRKSVSVSRIQRLPAKRRQAKEKRTSTNQNGGLDLLSNTLGDFMRAQAEERASQRATITLKKESDGSRDSKAKSRKQSLITKTDDLRNNPEGQQEPHILKANAEKRSRDGDSHRAISTEHTDSLSASRIKRKNCTSTNQNGGLVLLSNTLGDLMWAQAEERASQHATVTLKKESDGSRDSKAKSRKQSLITKTDDLCNNPVGQQEPHILKANAEKLCRDGDSHITISTEHTDSLSDAAPRIKRKDCTSLYKEEMASCVEKHGEKLVGCKIKVWWPMDKKFYEGAITSFDRSTKKHEVTYLDKEMELLNLMSERWELVSDEMASCVEKHGEKLVGCKIKVWWPMDKKFYEGAITSFDRLTKKHEVTYLDNEIELLNLMSERWELVSDEVQGIAANSLDNTLDDDLTYSCSPPRKRQKGQFTNSLIADVFSKMHGMQPPTILPQADSGSQINSSISRGKEVDQQLAGVSLPTEPVFPPSPTQLLASASLKMVNVHGYDVKPCNAPILRAIFRKHGDIASDCTFKTTLVKASLLEVICQVVKKIQSKDVYAILSEIETLDNQVADTHAANVNVSWLKDHLERYKRLKEAMEKCSSLKAVKLNAELVNKAAKREVEERLAGLVFAEKCVKSLEFVTKKINSDLQESETEESYLRMQLKEEELL